METVKELLRSDESFGLAYAKFMEEQINGSSGERKRRLLSDKRYAETLFLKEVFWPALKSFRRLFAEFEIRDYKDSWRYLDFAFIVNTVRICIEIDPFGTHFRNIDRNRYDDNLHRHNDLVLDDWKILRFSLDDIKNNPRKCQQTLMQAVAKWGLEDTSNLLQLLPIEYAVWKWVENHEGMVTPTSVARALRMNRETSAKYLKSLVIKGLILPASKDGKKIMRYQAKSSITSCENRASQR